MTNHTKLYCTADPEFGDHHHRLSSHPYLPSLTNLTLLRRFAISAMIRPGVFDVPAADLAVLATTDREPAVVRDGGVSNHQLSLCVVALASSLPNSKDHACALLALHLPEVDLARTVSKRHQGVVRTQAKLHEPDLTIPELKRLCFEAVTSRSTSKSTSKAQQSKNE